MDDDLIIAYFRHDISPTSDLEIMSLLNDIGVVGYGVFWIIVELLHRNKNRLYEKQIKSISSAYKIEEDLISKVLNNYTLFKKEKDYYYSDRVKKNLDEQTIKREQKQKAAKSKWFYKKKTEIQNFYKEEYEKVFNEVPTMTDEEVTTLYKLSETNSDFKDKLPIVLKRLSKIKFDDNCRFTPFSTWLLKSNNFSSVANGEFNKIQESEIRQRIADFKPEKIEYTEEDKAKIEALQKQGRELVNNIRKKAGK